jgi:phosphoribosylanthranilate isomerase
MVDVSSGVEASPGIKDHAKIRDFIAAARGALA